MDEGPERVEGESAARVASRSVRAITLVAVALVVVAVAVGVGLRGHRGSSDPWSTGFRAVDAAAVVQDAAQVRQDLAAPSGALSSLRFDCEIGRRDAARILSHPRPTRHDLAQSYETAIQQNWRLYATCVAALAPGVVSDAGALRTRLDVELGRLHRDEVRANAVASAVGAGPIFSVGP